MHLSKKSNDNSNIETSEGVRNILIAISQSSRGGQGISAAESVASAAGQTKRGQIKKNYRCK